MLIRHISAVIFFVVLAFFTFPETAMACQPTRSPSGGLISLAERVAQAPIILKGTVIAVRQSGTENIKDTATIQVTNYLKGYGPAVVEVKGFGYGPDCRPNVNDMRSGIFFIEQARNGDGFYLSSQLGLFAAAPVDKEIIAEIEQATGQTPITPVPVPNEQLPESAPFCLMIVCLVPIITLAVLGFIASRQANSNRSG